MGKIEVSNGTRTITVDESDRGAWKERGYEEVTTNTGAAPEVRAQGEGTVTPPPDGGRVSTDPGPGDAPTDGGKDS